MADAPKAVFANFLTPNAEIMTYSCADGTSISKGTLLQFSDPYTVAKAEAWATITTTTNGNFAGIAFADKEAGDGSTTIPVLKKGRADIRASGAITIGFPVYAAGNDEVRSLTVAQISSGLGTMLFGSMVVGYAEETATDGEVIIVRFDK